MSFSLIAPDHLHMAENLRQIPSRLRALNLFYNRFSSSVTTLRIEQRNTRCYLLSWSCIFTIILFYNLITKQTIYETLKEPQESDFVELTYAYGSAVHCKCSKKIIAYSAFSNRSARLHQVCSSQYRQTFWIESFLDSGIRSNLAEQDFRNYALGYFLALRYLCESTQRTVELTEWEISNRGIWDSGIISRDELMAQIYLVMNQTILQKIFNFKTILYAGRGLTRGNQLMNLFSSNWIFSPIDNTQALGGRVQNKPTSRGSNCSCSTSSDCTEPVTINSRIVPGFVKGCTALESVLRSTLTCLYDQSCIELINVGNSTLIQPLDSSVPSRFTSNSTVQDLVEYGFQEGWSLSIDYSHFLSECASHICDYSISRGKTVMEIVTLLLGLYGGLTIILRFFVPRLLGIIIDNQCITCLHKSQVVPAHWWINID